jgi:hypothetical protein
MVEPLKIKVDFDGNANAILQFIGETQGREIYRNET